jgi:hypothetical protein
MRRLWGAALALDFGRAKDVVQRINSCLCRCAVIGLGPLFLAATFSSFLRLRQHTRGPLIISPASAKNSRPGHTARRGASRRALGTSTPRPRAPSALRTCGAKKKNLFLLWRRSENKACVGGADSLREERGEPGWRARHVGWV